MYPVFCGHAGASQPSPDWFRGGVDGLALEDMSGFHPGLAEGGMGVYGAPQFAGGQFGPDGGGGFGYQLGCVRADGAARRRSPAISRRARGARRLLRPSPARRRW